LLSAYNLGLKQMFWKKALLVSVKQIFPISFSIAIPRVLFSRQIPTHDRNKSGFHHKELAVTPSLQYIKDPALNQEKKSLWAYGLRVRIAL
jgi:hypothetical protein